MRRLRSAAEVPREPLEEGGQQRVFDHDELGVVPPDAGAKLRLLVR